MLVIKYELCHFNANKIVSSIDIIEETKIMGIFLSETENINKHFILLPNNDVESYYLLNKTKMKQIC